MADEKKPGEGDKRDFLFSAYSRRRCGAGLAYDQVATRGQPLVYGAWECWKVIVGEVKLERAPTEAEALAGAPKGWTAAFAGCYVDTTGQVHDKYPFSFYEIKSEDQPSASGATTRPGGWPHWYRWQDTRRGFLPPTPADPVEAARARASVPMACRVCGVPKAPELETQVCPGKATPVAPPAG